jgi:hypothetical protein
MKAGWRAVCVIAGAGLVIVLVVVAIMWGLKGIEVASWIAGVAALVVAVVTLYVTWPRHDDATPPRNAPRDTNQIAIAEDRSSVYQAGGDITLGGDRNRP